MERRPLETHEQAAAHQHRNDTLIAIAGKTTRRDSFELFSVAVTQVPETIDAGFEK